MKKEIIKGYKGFDKDLKCRGFQYEIGKTYKMEDNISICNKGFHFCKDFKNVNGFYNFENENYRFCEVEALGNVVNDIDNSKSATNKIKIVREISREEMLNTLNFGKNNTGYFNTGGRNTGDWNTGSGNTGVRNTGSGNTGGRNTGSGNTGDCNTGYSNTGDRNTGYSNTGDRNTGDWNTGGRNTGSGNTGDWNTGSGNTGGRNTGDKNTGDSNTGSGNTGYSNTGDWNKTNRSSGVLCNQEPELMLFNKKTDISFEEWRNSSAFSILRRLSKSTWVHYYEMTDEEKIKYPNCENKNGYLKEITRKEASKKWWDNLDNYDKKTLFELPNFDLEVFNDILELEITKKEYKERMK